MNPIRFTVFGVAQPKGSTRAFMPKGARFPVVTSDNPKLKAWQRVVALAAVAARMRQAPSSGPVAVEIDFALPRPLHLAKKATRPHITRPDVDKLARGILDALSKVLFEDDGQVVRLSATKRTCELGEEPKAVVTVTPVELALFTPVPSLQSEAIS